MKWWQRTSNLRGDPPGQSSKFFAVRSAACIDFEELTRNIEPGDLVQPGRVLLEIARGGDTEIEVPIDEKNLAALALGQQAYGLADAFPDQPFAAVVNYIPPSIDARRGTVSVRLFCAGGYFSVSVRRVFSSVVRGEAA